MATKDESYEWFKDQIKNLKTKKTEDEEYLKMERRNIAPGSFIMFNYNNPKTKNLKFWDKVPVDLIFRLQGNDMWCINLHYIPRAYRKTVILHVLKINKANIRADRRLQANWEILKEFIVRNGFELAIHRYKVNRITNLKYIKTSELKYVAELPLEKFAFNGDMTEDDLYKMIYSHTKKTKSAKNVRFGRSTKK